MMKQRSEVQNDRWKPQIGMSVCDEMYPRYEFVQNITGVLRNAKNEKPDQPKLATKILYNQDTLLDFQIFTRDKSNSENPWVERTEILEDSQGILPSRWEKVNTAAARRNLALRQNRGQEIGNKRKREGRTNTTPESKKKLSPILNILKEGASASFQQPQHQQNSNQSQQQQSSVTISPAYQSLGITGTTVPTLPTLQMTNTRPIQMQVDPNVDVLQGAPGQELPPVDAGGQPPAATPVQTGGQPAAASGFSTSGIG